MRLTRLEVAGFGRIKDLKLDLAPGLNVVYGLNEAGKSTLQRFIQAMLYGLQKPGAAKVTRLPEYDRYRPWDGGDYRGALEYELADGRRFRVERDFARGPAATRILDAATGADVSARFPQDRRHELLFAAKHLGLSDGEFISTCCLPQLLTDHIELADEISERLANLVQAGAEDVSVRRALKVLEDQVAELGSDSAPTRPVARRRMEVQALATKLEEAQRARQALLAEEVRLREGEAQVAEGRMAVAEFEARLAATRRRSLELRLQKVREGEEAVAQAAATIEGLRPGPEVADPTVFEPAGRARLAELSQKVRSLRAERAGLLEEGRELEGRRDGLAVAPAGADGRLEALRRTQSELKAVDEELAAARSRLGDDRISELRSRLAGLEASARTGLAAGLAAVAGLAVVGAILGVAVNPLLFIVAALAVPAAVWTWSAHRSTTARVAETRRQLTEAQSQMDQVAGRARDLEDRRARLLGDAGVESPADLDRLVTHLVDDLAQFRARRTAVEEALAAARTKLERVEKELAEAEAALRETLAQAGAANLDDYLARAERYARYQKELTAHRQQTELLRQILGRETREGLESRLAELVETVPPGVIPFPDAELESRERELRELRERLATRERELARDRGNLEGRYRDLPDPADLDRRLEAARGELARLVEARDVLTTAARLIAEASEQVQRRFAPALNGEVAATVARLTGGAYPEIRVDRGFAMSVIVNGRSHRVQDLSRGTLDQFYFALRVAVTDLLTGGGEHPPFILDDSLVHYDDGRMAAAMALLAEIGRTHQVVLFTCHRREAAAARALGVEATLIELSGS